MMYHKFWNKEIPTMLGLGLIVIGLSVTTFLTGKQTFFQTGAQGNNLPQEVRITNITDSSFTVTYKTSSKASGYVNFGTSNSLGQTAFDEMDVSQKLQNHSIHSIALKNLNPLTKYYFTVISGGDTYLNNNQDFETITAATVPASTANEISGRIILPNASSPDETIVYITSDNNSQVLSSLVSNNGTYKINLNHLLNSDLSKLADLSEKSVIQMLILSDSLTSTAMLYYSQTNNIPVITLSNNYDFRAKEQKTSSQSASLESFPILSSTSSSKNKGVQILTPGKNQIFSNQKPVLTGKGIPNQKIQITIHSNQQINASVNTDANGNWKYQPSTALSPGNHTITVTAKDSSGILKTITQSFTVFAAETSPAPTAIIYSPTPTPTTISPSNVYSPTSPPEQSLPATGNTSIITAGIVGILITVVGGLIFLLSRKGI